MKWIKKIWNSFVRWFKGLFRKKYSTVKPSGCVSLYSMTSTGLEPQFEQYYTRRTALGKHFKRMGERNTDELMSMFETLYKDPAVEHEPTPEKRPFIKKK